MMFKLAYNFRLVTVFIAVLLALSLFPMNGQAANEQSADASANTSAKDQKSTTADTNKDQKPTDADTSKDQKSTTADTNKDQESTLADTKQQNQGDKIKNNFYSERAVYIVLGLLVLLALLFMLQLKWSNRLDQAGYLGQIFQKSIKDFEYKRFALIPNDKLSQFLYHKEIISDSKWCLENKMPVDNASGSYPWDRLIESSGSSGSSGSSIWSIPSSPTGPSREFRSYGDDKFFKYQELKKTAPGLIAKRNDGTLVDQSDIVNLAEFERLDKFYEQENQKKDQAENDWKIWVKKVESRANELYQVDLKKAEKNADESAKLAVDVEFSALRGRGGEFVLEFTTVVVIIFSTMILGVLGILGSEQIGTLLAAIAGYVLGKSATRASEGAKGLPAVVGANASAKTDGQQ